VEPTREKRVTRLDRNLAALRCVEAVRMYAAEHDGEPPTTLDDITQVPVPVDPFRGRPFTYRIEEGRAVIESLAPAEADPSDGLIYKITIRQETKEEYLQKDKKMRKLIEALSNK